MKRYFSAALVVATLGASLLAGTPAHAATGDIVRLCTFSLDVTFNPPLTLTNGSGTMHVTYGYSCTDVHGDGSITGATGGPASYDVGYTGNCLLLNYGGQLVGSIVGGSVLVSVDVGGASSLASAGEWVLTPNAVCNESSAHGTLGSFSGANVLLFPR